MTRDYSSRGLNRARYLIAGQTANHVAPFRSASAVRSGHLPSGLSTLRDLDFMDPANPFFVTDRALHSAGQYIGRVSPPPTGTFSKRPGNVILCDSGGLQFGRDPKLWLGDPSRAWVLNFLEANADEAISLDVPTRVITPGAPPFDSFNTALSETMASNAYFAANRSANLRLLSVLQGETLGEGLAWYEGVKAQPFEGWAFGGAMRLNYVYIAWMVQRLIADGLLGPERNRLHFLGVSSLGHAVVLSALQIALRRHLRDDELLITFDTSSPSKTAMVGKMYGYADLSSTSFAMSVFTPPSSHVHAGWPMRFPVKSSRISEVVNLNDLCDPAWTRQHGWDELGHAIATHHNLESLLRGIDEANSVMEMPSGWAVHHAPVYVIRAYRAIKTMFDHPNPFAHVRRFKADFHKL